MRRTHRLCVYSTRWKSLVIASALVIGSSFTTLSLIRSEPHNVPTSDNASTGARPPLGFLESAISPIAPFLLLLAPVMQPGSAKIAFASNRDGSRQIYVMNADGTDVTELTNSVANDDVPRWSPNGAKILFQSDRDHSDTGFMDIYVMNADGSGVTRLTFDNNDDSMASWSPDGTKIVFQSMRNGVNYGIYSMNADGSNQLCLSTDSSNDLEPSFSPDGTKIVFATDRDHAGAASIYVMNSDGSNQHVLTSTSPNTEDRRPMWSPNGSQIAFVSTRDSVTGTWQETDEDGNYITRSALHINKEIYVMNADGSGQTRLTNNAANDDAPSWSPLGFTIVFRSDRERDCCDPTAQIWSMNADGSNQLDLSNDGTNNYEPALTLDASNAGGQLASNYVPVTNQPPVANAGGSYTTQAGQVVQLNGAASFDPDGAIINYTWNFGDGTSGAGATANHQYSTGGMYSVSLTVTDNSGNISSSQGFVTVDSVAFPVKLTFDELPDNTVVADQYLKDYGVQFRSSNFAFPVHTKRDCGSTCGPTSFPNFISTKPDDTGSLIVTFQQPVSNLVFFAIGVDRLSGTFAFVDLYRNGSVIPSNSFAMNGNFTPTVGFSSGPLNNIDKLVVRGITDTAGIGFDDFSFTVPADVKITSGRVSGYLNDTNKNALLGADVALSASALPGAFSGGNYSWTCTSASLPNKCSIISGQNTSSVNLRANEVSSAVGNYTVTVNYTKGQTSTSSSMTINSVLPTLTSFNATQIAASIHKPFQCLSHGFPDVIQWFYALGCYPDSVGIQFSSHIHTEPYISDPNRSGIKYLQAVSAFRKHMARGTRCDTVRSAETNVDSGWQLDTANPYTCCNMFIPYTFSTAAGLMIPYDFNVPAEDYPDMQLTRKKDYDYIDVLYTDDRFQMYVLYYAGNDAGAPLIQRPLGKLAWNWGGLAVLDWDPNIPDAVHKIRSSNADPATRTGEIFTPAQQNMNSVITMNGNVESLPVDGTPCPGGVPFTDNPIDSSREFVKYHYKDFLDRDPNGEPDGNGGYIPGKEPDPTGWNFWTSNISQCVFDLTCVRFKRISTGLAFFQSAEFMQDDPIMANGPGTPNFNREAYNHEFVYWCYIAYLHKLPDQEGWDYWTGVLNSGSDSDNYSHMIDAFQVSDDYRNKRTFQ